MKPGSTESVKSETSVTEVIAFVREVSFQSDSKPPLTISGRAPRVDRMVSHESGSEGLSCPVCRSVSSGMLRVYG